MARVQRRERVLKDDLHPATKRTHPFGAKLADVLAVEQDPAGGRLVQPQ